jgi:hypothetical protein
VTPEPCLGGPPLAEAPIITIFDIESIGGPFTMKRELSAAAL